MYLYVNVRVRGVQEGGGRVDAAGGHMQGAAPVCSNYNSIYYHHSAANNNRFSKKIFGIDNGLNKIQSSN